MVNPDGVYYGNYRTNLSGNDLNRKWRNPSRTLHPEIYYLRKYLCEINRNNPISLIIDFHGHSRKYPFHNIDSTPSSMATPPTNQYFHKILKYFLICAPKETNVSPTNSPCFPYLRIKEILPGRFSGRSSPVLSSTPFKLRSSAFSNKKIVRVSLNNSP